MYSIGGPLLTNRHYSDYLIILKMNIINFWYTKIDIV